MIYILIRRSERLGYNILGAYARLETAMEGGSEWIPHKSGTKWTNKDEPYYAIHKIRLETR